MFFRAAAGRAATLRQQVSSSDRREEETDESGEKRVKLNANKLFTKNSDENQILVLQPGTVL